MSRHGSYATRAKALRSLGFDTYADYLKSSLWRRLRLAAKARAEGRCEVCGGPGTEAHHRSYAPGVLAGDTNCLVWLCRSCHQDAEFVEGRKVDHRKANQRLIRASTSNGRKLLSSCLSPGCNYIRSASRDLCGYCAKDAPS